MGQGPLHRRIQGLSADSRFTEESLEKEERINKNGKTDLLVIEGNLNANRYVQEVLTPHVVPYAGAIGDGFVLMDDNAGPHRGRVVDRLLWLCFFHC